jgi:hypothetical protein
VNKAFQIGEIVIIQNDPAITIQTHLHQLDGEEAEIIGPLQTWPTVAGPFYAYVLYHPAVGTICCAPHELRRRRPPTTGEQAVRAMFDALSKPVLEAA